MLFSSTRFVCKHCPLRNCQSSGNDHQLNHFDLKRMSFTENAIRSIDRILESTDYEFVKEEVNKLTNERKINSSVFDHLQTVLINVDCDTNLLNSIALLSLSSSVPELKDAVFFKLVELLRLSKMSNLKETCNLVMYCKFILQITSKAYFPEMIKTVQNILILFGRRTENDKLFLPIYKLQRLKNRRNFLHFTTDQSELIEFDFKTIASIDYDNLDEDKLKFSLLNEVLDLINQLKDRYKQLEAFESIFYFINKLVDQLIVDYPFLEVKLRQTSMMDCKPKLTHLVLPRQRPQILPMLEPNYSAKLKHTDKEMEQSMRKKLKRETKSVQRELKKDSAFISSVKLEETLEKDRIRKEKVKRLIAEIQEERSMFKK